MGGEQISDTVRFKHHAIAIPQLTPADRILEATKQLESASKQQPKKAPIAELTTREVLLGERKAPLPPNSVQKTKNGASPKRKAGEQRGERNRTTTDRRGATHQRHIRRQQENANQR